MEEINLQEQNQFSQQDFYETPHQQQQPQQPYQYYQQHLYPPDSPSHHNADSLQDLSVGPPPSHHPQDDPDDLHEEYNMNETEIHDEGGQEADPADDLQLSKCFKNTLAYAGRGRRLFKMRRGGGFKRGGMMNRGMQGRKMLYGRRDSSPTITMPTMRESGVMLTNEVDSGKRKWSLSRGGSGGKSVSGGRSCWNLGLKKKTKCCLKKCRRCRSTCFKLILVLFNFFFMLCGWSMVVLGSYIHLNHQHYLYFHLLTPHPEKAFFAIHKIPFLFIGAGLVLSIVSFLGCCGACTESVCFLSFYSFFLSIMVLGEMTLGVMSNTLRLHVTQQMHTNMMYQITHLYNSTASQPNETAPNILQLTKAWDSFHQEFHCCGVLGPKDFDNSSWHSHVKDGDGIYVPDSCCTGSNPYSLCQAEALLHPRPESQFLGTHYVNGCLTVLLDMMNTQLNNFTFTLVCLISIQFLDLVLACVLMSWVKKKQSDYWWGTDDDCG